MLFVIPKKLIYMIMFEIETKLMNQNNMKC